MSGIYSYSTQDAEEANGKGVVSSSLSESLSAKLYDEIMSNREQILKAFIAETKLLPSECEQVWEPHKLTWSVRKREAV